MFQVFSLLCTLPTPMPIFSKQKKFSTRKCVETIRIKISAMKNVEKPGWLKNPGFSFFVGDVYGFQNDYYAMFSPIHPLEAGPFCLSAAGKSGEKEIVWYENFLSSDCFAFSKRLVSGYLPSDLLTIFPEEMVEVSGEHRAQHSDYLDLAWGNGHRRRNSHPGERGFGELPCRAVSGRTVFGAQAV